MSGRVMAPSWWVPGDWNGFFGLFTNVALNVIVLTGLCLGVVQFAGRHRVRPRAAGAGHRACRSAICSMRIWPGSLAKREGRDDVTALPYGPSVPHMFIVVFLVMLPTYLKTNDPILAWQAGLAWAFIIGIIILLGAFVGPTIRKYTPRAAMLGALAGISIAFISMRPAALSWQVPWLAFISLGDHPGELVRAGAAAVGSAGRIGRGAGRDRAGVDRDVHRHQPGDGPACGWSGVGQVRPALADTVGRFPGRDCRISGRCWSSRCRSASTISPRG